MGRENATVGAVANQGLAVEAATNVSRNTYPAEIQLSDTAEKYLANLADALVLGTVEYWQLPPSLRALSTYSFEAGRQSRQDEIDEMQRQRDLFYIRWTNPGKELRAYTERQLDIAAAAYWEEFLNTNTQLNTEQDVAA